MIKLLSKLVRSQRGQATLAIVLILMLIGGILIPPTLSLATTSLTASRHGEELLKERYASDAAAEYAIWALSHNGTLREEVEGKNSSLGQYYSLSLPGTINNCSRTCHLNCSVLEGVLGSSARQWQCKYSLIGSGWGWVSVNSSFDDFVHDYLGLHTTSTMTINSGNKCIFDDFHYTLVVENKDSGSAVRLKGLSFRDNETYYKDMSNIKLERGDGGNFVDITGKLLTTIEENKTENNVTTTTYSWGFSSDVELDKKDGSNDAVRLSFDLNRANPSEHPEYGCCGESFWCHDCPGQTPDDSEYGEAEATALGEFTDVDAANETFKMRVRLFDIYVYDEDTNLKLKARMIYWPDAFPLFQVDCNCSESSCFIWNLPKCILQDIMRWLVNLFVIHGPHSETDIDIVAWDYQ